MRLSILFLFFVTIISSSSFAQSDEEEFPYKYSFQILFWEEASFHNPFIAKPPPLELTFLTKDGPQDFTAYQASISPVYQYEADKPLILYSKDSVDGQTKYEPLIRPNLSASKGYFLIMFTDQGNSKYSAKVLDISEKSIPKGTITFYNYSTENLRAIFGSKKFSLNPGGALNTPMSTLSKEYYCKYRVAQKIDNNWKSTISNTMHLDNNIRILNIFYHQDLTKGPILLRSLDLSNPPDQAQEADVDEGAMPLPGPPPGS